jgi:soluble lytic murein transglycosylase
MKRKKRAGALLIILFAVFLLINTPLVWKWMYPIKYEAEIVKAAKHFEVDPHLVLAIIRSESAFDPSTVSKKGAVGLMQVMPDTAEWVIGQAGFQTPANRSLQDPTLNINIGTWYLSYLLQSFDNNLVQALAAYNAGPGKVNSWLARRQWNGTVEDIEHIPFGETRHYVQRVLYYHERYKKIYKNLPE